MNKDRKAKLLTVVVLLAAVGLGVARKTGWRLTAQSAAETPEDAIYAMLEAARNGDVRKYLGVYTGQMQATLRQSVAESGEPAFAKYLKETNAAIKGVAVSDIQTTGEKEAKARVEYVYQDRNEIQMMYLEKAREGWKIARADSDQRIPTLIPYGTPVK